MPLCIVVSDDTPIANAVVWSLPIERLDGFILVGACARSRRSPTGCHDLVDMDLSDRKAAREALAGLGYTPEEIRETLREIPTDTDSSTLLRQALKTLGARRA